MKLTDICRESLTAIDFTEPISTLAEDAKQVLGYSVLQEQKDNPKSTLRSKLAALQLDILRQDDVDKYKKEQLIERTKEKMQEWCGNATSNFFGPGWSRTPIARYAEPIPEFVLNKAIQIKKAIPEVLIFIESLSDYPDPFLVVATKHPQYDCLTEEEHYVEVWEEPKFEGYIR